MARNANRQAAAERKAANGKKTHDQKVIEALQFERAGYVTRGLTKRVTLVDAQIKAYGGRAPASTPAGDDAQVAGTAGREEPEETVDAENAATDSKGQ